MSDAPRSRPARDTGADAPGGKGKGAAGGSGDRSRASGGGAPETSRTEWIVAGVSALVVLGALGTLVADAVRSPATPPDLRVEVESIVPAGPGYLVRLRARNHGHETAADVVIEGELWADTGRVEASQTTVDYVPGQAMRRVGLYFVQDPRRLRLRLKPHGYDEP